MSDILILKVNFFFLGKVVVPRLAAGEGAQGTTCEEYNSHQFPIVKEVIKGPKTAILGKGIWGQIRSVRIDVAIGQVNFLVQGCPQRMSHLGVVIHGRHAQQVVDAIDDRLYKEEKKNVINFSIYGQISCLFQT